MSRFVVIGLAFLAVCLPAPAGTVGKTTVDPNASANTSQKVTYEARRKTVVSILADLSKMTGVTLRAGWRVEDWQVRDRRMNVFAKDVPLSNLMNSIARVMKFKWSKSGDDPPIYRLYMDRQVLLDTQRQRSIEEEKLSARQTEARQEFISDLEEAAGMSEDELQKLKVKSPYIYRMTKNGWAGVFASLCAEVPKAKQAWLSGQELVLEMRSLSPTVQQSLMKLQHGLDQEMIDKGILTINNSENLNSGNFGAPFGNATIKFDGPTYETDFQDPESDLTKASGRLWYADGTFGPDDKADQSEIDRLKNARDRAIAANPMNLDEPLTEHPDDPILSAKVKMNVKGDDFADTVCALAKSSGLAVVSDSFYGQIRGLSFPQDEIQVRAVLDKLESVCRYNWERHSSILELHDRDWFRKRSAQIPDAWLEAWRKAFKDNGLLDLSELSQMAMLTRDQYDVNVYPDDILGKLNLDYVAWEDQDLLRLYAGLNKSQRASILGKQGLSLDSVTGDHSQAIHALVPKGVSEAGLRLVGTQEMQGKQIRYTFSLLASNGSTIKQWRIECPVYNPVAKEKPKAVN